MKGGVLLGSITLIAIYVFVQPGVSGRVSDASNAYVSILRRLLSPDAAGIGNHGAPPGQKATFNPAPSASGGGGGGVPRFTNYFQPL